jgi:hypothetical protein
VYFFSESIATGCGLVGRGVGVRAPLESRVLVLYVQTGSKVHPASCPMGAGAKRAGRDHSPPTSAELKKKKVDLYIHSPIRLHDIALN